MLRVGREAEAEALAIPGVGPMKMGGKPKRGYVWIDADAFADDAGRGRLIDMAVACVTALPPKAA